MSAVFPQVLIDLVVVGCHVQLDLETHFGLERGKYQSLIWWSVIAFHTSFIAASRTLSSTIDSLARNSARRANVYFAPRPRAVSKVHVATNAPGPPCGRSDTDRHR